MLFIVLSLHIVISYSATKIKNVLDPSDRDFFAHTGNKETEALKIFLKKFSKLKL